MDVRQFAVALNCEPLTTALAAHLAAAGPRVSRSALQLLQPACPLLNSAPLGSEEGTPFQQVGLVRMCWALLHNVCTVLLDGLVDGLPADAGVQQTSRLLLQVPLWLVPLLQWHVELLLQTGQELFQDAAVTAMQSCGKALALLSSMAVASMKPAADGEQPCSLAAPLPYLTAASAMLRSLPGLMDFAQRHGSMMRRCADWFVGNVANAVCDIASGAAAGMKSSLHLSNLGDDPSFDCFSAAVFQLHTQFCRAAHWSQAALPEGSAGISLLAALNALLQAAGIAHSLAAAKGTSPLGPMSAAHSVAVQVLLSGPGQARQLASSDAPACQATAGSLAAALATCPQPATLDPELPALLAQLTSASVQVSSVANMQPARSEQRAKWHRGLLAACVCWVLTENRWLIPFDAEQVGPQPHVNAACSRRISPPGCLPGGQWCNGRLAGRAVH